MPITEAQRHHLLTRLEAAIGKEAAMTLADHLPPVGWADVATKTDLDHLAIELRGEFHREIGRLDARIGHLDGRIGHLDASLSRHVNRALLANTVATVTLVLAGMQLVG